MRKGLNMKHMTITLLALLVATTGFAANMPTPATNNEPIVKLETNY